MQRLSAPERTREELRSLMNGAESIRWTATPDAAAALAEAESAAKALGAMRVGIAWRYSPRLDWGV